MEGIVFFLTVLLVTGCEVTDPNMVTKLLIYSLRNVDKLIVPIAVPVLRTAFSCPHEVAHTVVQHLLIL